MTRTFRRLPMSETVEDACDAADGTPVLEPGPDGTVRGVVEMETEDEP